MEVAYLTCEFAFAFAPAIVRGLQARDVTQRDVTLSWLPPVGEDRTAPLLGYRVEACALHREGQAPDRPRQAAAAPSWRLVSDLELSAEPGIVVQGLRYDTRYRFRVRGMSEAGAGEPAEVEATTGPSAPSACGRPRLAGCAGPVLTVEWETPADDGGARIVTYRLWVRAFTASQVDPSEWFELGHVPHREARMQRAQLHTEELNPTFGRYLCCVAAVNAAGEVGPATPDGACLPFPNPCAVCGPGLQGTYPSLPGPDAAAGADSWQRDAEAFAGVATMTLMEPGKRPVHVPMLGSSPDLAAEISVLRESLTPSHATALVIGQRMVPSALISPTGSGASGGGTSAGAMWGAAADWGDFGFHAGDSMPPARVAPAAAAAAAAAAAGRPLDQDFGVRGFGAVHGLGLHDVGEPLGIGLQVDVHEQHEDLREKLREKRELLEMSLLHYRQVGNQLSFAPDNHQLRRSHEEAEIEAAGYQAEVAVLAQNLGELEAQLRAPQVDPLYMGRLDDGAVYDSHR